MLELAIGSTLPMDGSLCQALRQDKAPLPKRLNANSQLVKYIKVTVASLTPLPSPWSHSHGIISPKQNSSPLSLSVHADSVTACRQRGLKCVSARDAARHFCLRPPARGQRLRQYAEARRRGGRASGASCCSPARCRGAPNKQEPRVDGGEIIYAELGCARPRQRSCGLHATVDSPSTHITPRWQKECKVIYCVPLTKPPQRTHPPPNEYRSVHKGRRLAAELMRYARTFGLHSHEHGWSVSIDMEESIERLVANASTCNPIVRVTPGTGNP